MALAATVVAASLGAVAPLSAQQVNSSPSPAPERGVQGPLLLIEPFAGRLHLAEEIGMPRQEVLGVGGGIEFTRYFALRGFYWRGVDPEGAEFQPLQGYGGEAQVTFRAPGVFSFLVGGVGQLDFGAGAAEEPLVLPADRRALIVGGGIGLAPSRRLRLSVALRDYILTADPLDEEDGAVRRLHNPLLNVGLTVALGGGPAQPRRRTARVQRDRLDQDIERAFAERDRFLARIQERRAEVEEQRRREAGLLGQPVSPPGAAVPARGAPAVREAERTLVIPVPEQGEIYIRYGTPGGVRIEAGSPVAGGNPGPGPVMLRPSPQLDPRGLSPFELRVLIREAVREELGLQTAPRVEAPPRVEELPHQGRARVLVVPPTPAPAPAAAAPALTPDERLELLERRLLQRIDELIEQRLREREQGLIPAPPPPRP